MKNQSTVTYLAIQDATTKDIVFGYPIADYLTLDSVPSLDGFVRTKIEELFAGFHLRSNRVRRGPVQATFTGLLCRVAEDPASYDDLYEVHVVSMDELGYGTKSVDHLRGRNATWWRNEYHKEGGWAERDAAASGNPPTRNNESEDEVASRNFWSAFQTAMITVFLLLITFGTVSTLYDAFTDD